MTQPASLDDDPLVQVIYELCAKDESLALTTLLAQLRAFARATGAPDGSSPIAWFKMRWKYLRTGR